MATAWWYTSVQRSVWVTVSLLIGSYSMIPCILPQSDMSRHWWVVTIIWSTGFVTKLIHRAVTNLPLPIFASLLLSQLLLFTHTHTATLSPHSRGNRTKGISTFLSGLLLDLQPSDKIITRSAESPHRQKLPSWSTWGEQASINWCG